MKMIIKLLTAAAVLTLVLTSCNLFKAINPPFTGTSVNDFLARGDAFYNDSQYVNALNEYSNAMIVNPKSSIARLSYARAYLWIAFPELLALFATKTNLNFVSAIDVMNSPEGRAAIYKFNSQNLFLHLAGVLDSPDGILNGQGDSTVNMDEMEFNQLLLVAYAGTFIMELLDSDHNGIHAASGDYIIITNGDIGFAMDLQSSLDTLMGLTNFDVGSNMNDVTNMMKLAFDKDVEMLVLARFLKTQLNNVDKILNTLVRPTILENLPAQTPASFPNLREELRDVITNTNSPSSLTSSLAMFTSVKTIPDAVAGPLNEFHNALVGSYAFPTNGSILDFTPLPWTSFTGGLKGTFETLISVSNMTNIDADALSNMLDEITNSFTMDELSNLLAQFGQF